MREDLNALSDQITSLINNFTAYAISHNKAQGKPMILSLSQFAPCDFPDTLIEKYIDVIQAELQQRPEIKTAHIPKSIEDFSERKAFDPLVLVVEVNKNAIATDRLSIGRLAEIGKRSLEYVQEESQDPIQDLTERLGLSMDEVSTLIPEYNFLTSPPNHHLSSLIQSARKRSETSHFSSQNLTIPAIE